MNSRSLSGFPTNRETCCRTYEDNSTTLPNLPTMSGSEDKLVDRSSAKTTGTSWPDPDLGLASERLPGLGLSTSSWRAEKPDKEPGAGRGVGVGVGGQPR